MPKMKVVILCGGRGTRLGKETDLIPKPMIQVGDKPILWHIMKIYACHGFKDFILCTGYKGEVIREFFLNYSALNYDFTINLGERKMKLYGNHPESGWNVTLADTGLKTMTGARLKRVEKYIDSDIFMFTYGDGVANIDINKLISFHKSHKKIGTVTGILPFSKFGELAISGKKVTDFGEKARSENNYVSGGFFVFSKKFFKYLSSKEDCTLEDKPLSNLTKDGELMVYKHNDFWQCLDTPRDISILNELWEKNLAKWKIWE